MNLQTAKNISSKLLETDTAKIKNILNEADQDAQSKKLFELYNILANRKSNFGIGLLSGSAGRLLVEEESD